MVKLRDRNHLYALPYTWSELHNFWATFHADHHWPAAVDGGT
jgi:hypothetical protein